MKQRQRRVERKTWVVVGATVAAIVIAAVAGYALAIFNADTTPSASASHVLVGAGDVALCSREDDEDTAALLGRTPGTVFLAGDGGYPEGTLEDYTECYGPGWGRFLSRTRPAPGNHDYRTPDASGYFEYFGDRAGPPGRGYYSFEMGGWHVVSLNSNCDKEGVDCTARGDQVTWLTEDLATHGDSCVLAFWHHPLFSSGRHGGDDEVRPFWDALYEAGADVILVGHDHIYERFAEQDPNARADPQRGIRQFVVGTGGGELYPIDVVAANSEARTNETHGVLKLTLREGGYDWEFVPVGGSSFNDRGSDGCN
ncbi:MAG: metallophosphoesterase [Chloroflexi bacterium]|nr:metallophosphoesterase [Chloroflexota bacterium]